MRAPVSSGASAIGAEASEPGAPRGGVRPAAGVSQGGMSTEPPDSDAIRPDSAARRDRKQRILRLAGKQKQLITLRQLLHIGLGRRAISHRVSAGRLFRIHQGVFALHPPPYSRHQLYLAAVGACGLGSAVSDLAAAWLLGMREDPPSLPHITNATGRGRALAGFVVHERIVDARDVITRFAIPCTSPARTIVDCAASVPIEELEELLMAADSGRPGLDRRRLEALVAGSSGARGIRNLRELITNDPKETQAENERRMLRICRRVGLPEPETQYEVRAGERVFRADFCWPALGLIVECDSWRWHGGKRKTERDRERDQILAIAGWRVVHFTRNQIKLAPAETGRKLAALLASRAASGG